MKRLFFCLLPVIIFASFFGVRAQNQPFQFRVSFEEIANLTYQLDCLNDFAYCRKEDYSQLWDREFLKTPDDRKMLEAWKNIRDRYTGSAKVETNIKFPLDQRSNQINLADKISIAGLQPKNLDDYLSRLDLLVIPNERENFEKVIRYFQPRFSVWWEREARVQGAGFPARINDLLKSPGIRDNIDRFYNFYEPYLPENYVVTFDLLYRPNLVKTGSSGRSMENHLLVEFLAGEDPSQRIAVVLHEFCHFMFNSLPNSKHIELQNAFLKSGRKTAVPAFNLMDETLATTFGNGIIARSVMSDEVWKRYLVRNRSFYNNPNLDKGAKALLPVMDEWLAKGGKLNDPKFVELYIGTLEKDFGPRLSAPQLFLGQSFLFMDEKFDRELRRSTRQALNIASFYSEQNDLNKSELGTYFNNPNLSSVFIIRPQNMTHLARKKVISAKDFAEIRKTVNADKKALYAVSRNENTYTFIIVAETDETAKQLVQDLADAPKSFSGKYIKQ